MCLCVCVLGGGRWREEGGEGGVGAAGVWRVEASAEVANDTMNGQTCWGAGNFSDVDDNDYYDIPVFWAFNVHAKQTSLARHSTQAFYTIDGRIVCEWKKPAQGIIVNGF